jgi:hypothetical protein
MSETFQRRNTPALERIVAETTKGEAYGNYEAMKDQLRAALSLPNPATEGLEFPPAPTAQQAAASMPVAAPGEPIDVRVLYLHKNSRFEIYGTTAQLDAQEARLRALYQH